MYNQKKYPGTCFLDKTPWTIRSWRRPPGLYAPGQDLVDYTLLDKTCIFTLGYSVFRNDEIAFPNKVSSARHSVELGTFASY